MVHFFADGLITIPTVAMTIIGTIMIRSQVRDGRRDEAFGTLMATMLVLGVWLKLVVLS
jgi:hypothetical protein